jgi:hypothetical protein
MGGECSTHGEKRNAHRLLARKPEGRRPLARTKRRWVDNIKMDLREIGWGGEDWLDLPQDRNRFESSCECGTELSGSIKCWETIKWLHNWWPLE